MSRTVPVNEHILSALGGGDLGQIIPIVSLHWAGMREERKYRTKIKGGHTTIYPIPPVKKHTDCPEILLVMDAVERQYLGGRKYGQDFSNTTAPQVANDLVRCATGGLDGDDAALFPAVWISQSEDAPHSEAEVADFKRLWSNPGVISRKYPQFFQEIKRFKEREWRYCESYVQIADRLHAESRRDQIHDNPHRHCATWLGLNPDEHLWMVPTMFEKTKACPFCTTPMPIGSVFCTACNHVTDPQEFERRQEAARVKHIPMPPAPEQAEAVAQK